MNTVLFIICFIMIFLKTFLMPTVAEKYYKALNYFIGMVNTAVGTVLFLIAYKASDIDPFILGLTVSVMLFGLRDFIGSCMECKGSCVECNATYEENNQIRKVG